VEASLLEVKYAIDTFYFLVMGAFVMLMACGFAMLEAGLVRTKKYSRDTYQKYSFVLASMYDVPIMRLCFYVSR
jgi:ammonia channel protein AmtB